VAAELKETDENPNMKVANLLREKHYLRQTK
jgi:hypothetical protein